jgi:lysozyme family protein
MPTKNDEIRDQLMSTINILLQRRSDTPDAAEKATINRTIKSLNLEVNKIDQADLLAAAASIAAAADAVEAAIKSAKVRPFDDYLKNIGEALAKLGETGGEIHGVDRLPQAAEPAGPPAAPAAPPTPPPAGLPPINATARTFDELKNEYSKWYAGCQLLPHRKANADFYVSRILKFKANYQLVSAEVRNIPWQLVGIIHGMEAGFNFKGHLHNGDPIDAKTVHEPAGRPKVWNPPFTWKASAIDALMGHDLHQVAAWSTERMLYELERYNGFGYRRRGLPTAYLWSFSNLYDKGKFVSDGVFDPEKRSEQCGAALIMKRLEAEGAGI